MTNLLSREAEAIYWLARYMERAENLARVLDVTETFTRDLRGRQDWKSVLEIFADAKRYEEAHGEPTDEGVIRYYTFDRANSGSILSTIWRARENARSLRPLISREMWTQINIFYNDLLIEKERMTGISRLSRFCNLVKSRAQTHSGIVDGVFLRDAGWYIYQIGRLLERADQTTRIIDVKYHVLLPSAFDVGTPQDVGQWMTLLRSVAGFHAYRRVRSSDPTPASVAGFLLFNAQFPRSVRACIAEIEINIDLLKKRYDIAPTQHTESELHRLRQTLDQETARSVIGSGLHEFLDRIQLQLMALNQELSASFFAKTS